MELALIIFGLAILGVLSVIAGALIIIVHMLCKKYKIQGNEVCNRIEFKYVDF